MKKRTKLADRPMPDYYRGEEIMNMVTHIVGGALGIVALVLCVVRAAVRDGAPEIVGTVIYGVSMTLLYTISSVYHGLHPSTGKKVLQVIDHCTIYLLIAGSYTPICLGPLLQMYPALGIGMLIFQWGMAALAITLTAIDLEIYGAFSMVCYIGMGWGIILFAPQAMAAMGAAGFWWLLSGGIAYTIGAVLYGIGSKIHWMHSIFHIFVDLGSVLQFFAIFFYAL